MLPPVQNRSLWPESHNLGIEKCAWVCPSYTWLLALVCSCLHVCARVCVWTGLTAFLLALPMVIWWVVWAAAGGSWSHLGASSLVGWMALTLSPALS